jgi:hypothetical protein
MKRIVLPAASALVVAALTGGVAQAAVFLNEITIRGVERVELYNSGPGIEDVNGWTIESAGSFEIEGLPPLAPGAYVSFAIEPPIFDDSGGFIELLDISQEDRVAYGKLGSAPLPPSTGFSRLGPPPPSLARAPDASTYGAPPTPDPSTDGLFWTLDLSPTFGAVNDAPTAALGSSLSINELDPKPVGTGDFVELYNPAAVPVLLAGWFLTNGDAFQALAGVVPGGGHLTITTDPGFELEATELLYLFDPAEVRVDQIGVHLPPVRGHAPTLDVCQCYARYEDGDGPNIGYDWFTSGGWSTLLTLTCTPDAENHNVTDCTGTAAPEMSNETWGRVKARWRER